MIPPPYLGAVALCVASLAAACAGAFLVTLRLINHRRPA